MTSNFQSSGALLIGVILITAALIVRCPMRRVSRVMLYAVAVFCLYQLGGVATVLNKQIANVPSWAIDWYSNVGLVALLIVSTVLLAIHLLHHFYGCPEEIKHKMCERSRSQRKSGHAHEIVRHSH